MRKYVEEGEWVLEVVVGYYMCLAIGFVEGNEGEWGDLVVLKECDV